jgi:uncharacterized membrane protein
MKTKRWMWAPVVFAAAFLGCAAALPTGPSVMVLPAPGKSFEAFQADEAVCRQWAFQQSGAQPGQTINQTIADNAAVGTLAGAAIGAAIGSTTGHAGSGAAIGAGTGLLAGAAAGSGPAYASGWELQRRYDIAYQQCMYAKGNQLPGAARHGRRAHRIVPIPPPPPPQ